MAIIILGCQTSIDLPDVDVCLRKHDSQSTYDSYHRRRDSLQDEESEIESEYSGKYTKPTSKLGKLKEQVHNTINGNKEYYIPVRERK